MSNLSWTEVTEIGCLVIHGLEQFRLDGWIDQEVLLIELEDVDSSCSGLLVECGS